MPNNKRQLDSELHHELKTFKSGGIQPQPVIKRIHELFQQAGYHKQPASNQSQIDPIRLELELKQMRYHNPIFKIVQRVLSERGYWRNHPRGNSKLGWAKSHGAKDDD